MKIFNYHPTNGELIGESLADESPLETGVFLIPAFATDVAPPAPVAGKSIVFAGGTWQIVDVAVTAPPAADEPTPEQLHEKARRERDVAVSNIVVTTQSGKTFDGDETSQTRMSRAIIGMDDPDVMPWKLADNTIATVSKAELREALRLSGSAQSALWFIP